jgi:hypothetical protein
MKCWSRLKCGRVVVVHTRRVELPTNWSCLRLPEGFQYFGSPLRGHRTFRYRPPVIFSAVNPLLAVRAGFLRLGYGIHRVRHNGSGSKSARRSSPASNSPCRLRYAASDSNVGGSFSSAATQTSGIPYANDGTTARASYAGDPVPPVRLRGCGSWPS